MWSCKLFFSKYTCTITMFFWMKQHSYFKLIKLVIIFAWYIPLICSNFCFEKGAGSRGFKSWWCNIYFEKENKTAWLDYHIYIRIRTFQNKYLYYCSANNNKLFIFMCYKGILYTLDFLKHNVIEYYPFLSSLVVNNTIQYHGNITSECTLFA